MQSGYSRLRSGQILAPAPNYAGAASHLRAQWTENAPNSTTAPRNCAEPPMVVQKQVEN